jgi:VanZ family protein
MPVRPITLLRAWRAIGVGLILLVIWLSLTPSPIEIPVEQGDKIGHLAAYGTLMFWFAQLDARRRTRLGYAVGFIALGIALEFAQGMTDYRVFEVADMIANAAGVLLGWIIAPPRGPDVLGFMQRML